MGKKYSRRKEPHKIPGRRWAENRLGKYKVTCEGIGHYFVKKKDADKFKRKCDNDPITKELRKYYGNKEYPLAKIKKLKGSFY